MPRNQSQPDEVTKPIRRPRRKDDRNDGDRGAQDRERPDYSEMAARAERKLERSLRTIVRSQDADLDELEDDDFEELERLSRREMGSARASKRRPKRTGRQRSED